jgi:hypothetical protein
LIHEGTLLNPVLAIQHLKVTLQSHYLACKSVALSSLWLPPFAGCIKRNFDVAIRDNFAIAAVVISNSSGEVICAVTQKLSVSDVLKGEAFVALLATRLAASMGILVILCLKGMLF